MNEECKSNGGIARIYVTEYSNLKTAPVDNLKPGTESTDKWFEHTVNFKIFSPRMKKLIKWLNQEIKDCERSAEEYFQELDNPEEGNQQLAKAEALESVKKFIHEN